MLGFCWVFQIHERKYLKRAYKDLPSLCNIVGVLYKDKQVRSCFCFMLG